jgi:predicted transcriptional regulator
LYLTTTIVTSYVSGNQIPVDSVLELISKVYTTLANKTPQVTQADPEPFVPVQAVDTPYVPVKKSVFPDHLICLCCGRKAKMLKRHIRTSHGLTVEQYRAKWDLPDEYPMVAPSYSEVRSGLAKANGLGRTR